MLKNAFINLLAILIVIGFFAVLVLWMYHPPALSEGPMAILNALTGALITAFTLIVGYFFGSSKGSSAKDDTITQMASRAPAVVAPVPAPSAIQP